MHDFWTDNNTDILFVIPMGLRSYGNLSNLTMQVGRELGLTLYDILFCWVFSLVFFSVSQFSIAPHCEIEDCQGLTPRCLPGC